MRDGFVREDTAAVAYARARNLAVKSEGHGKGSRTDLARSHYLLNGELGGMLLVPDQDYDGFLRAIAIDGPNARNYISEQFQDRADKNLSSGMRILVWDIDQKFPASTKVAYRCHVHDVLRAPRETVVEISHGSIVAHDGASYRCTCADPLKLSADHIQYTQRLVHLLQECIRKFYIHNEIVDHDPESDFLQAVVCTAPVASSEVMVNDAKIHAYKVGLHIYFPRLVLTRERALTIRETVLCDVMNAFGSPPIGKWGDIVDEAVFLNNGVRMLFSHQCTKCPACHNVPMDRANCFECSRQGYLDSNRPYTVLIVLNHKGEPDPVAISKVFVRTEKGHDEVARAAARYEALRMTSVRLMEGRSLTPGYKVPDGAPLYVQEGKGTVVDARLGTRMANTKRGPGSMMSISPGTAVYATLENLVRSFHPNYAKLTVVSVDASPKGTYYKVHVRGENDRFCLCKGALHTSVSIYFVVKESGVFQNCYSKNHQGASTIPCKDVRRRPVPIANQADRNVLFPNSTTSGQMYAPTSYGDRERQSILSSLMNGSTHIVTRPQFGCPPKTLSFTSRDTASVASTASVQRVPSGGSVALSDVIATRDRVVQTQPEVPHSFGGRSIDSLVAHTEGVMSQVQGVQSGIAVPTAGFQSGTQCMKRKHSDAFGFDTSTVVATGDVVSDSCENAAKKARTLDHVVSVSIPASPSRSCTSSMPQTPTSAHLAPSGAAAESALVTRTMSTLAAQRSLSDQNAARRRLAALGVTLKTASS